jgi:hypothetical protein
MGIDPFARRPDAARAMPCSGRLKIRHNLQRRSARCTESSHSERRLDSGGDALPDMGFGAETITDA